MLLPGVIGVVFDGAGRILLNRRTDNGQWSLISGICEFDEQPAETLRREVCEETGVEVEVGLLLDAWMSPRINYPNGDRAQYLTVAYVCRAVGGEARVCDDESHEVRFFAPDALPPLHEEMSACIARALERRAGSAAPRR